MTWQDVGIMQRALWRNDLATIKRVVSRRFGISRARWRRFATKDKGRGYAITYTTPRNSGLRLYCVFYETGKLESVYVWSGDYMVGGCSV